MTRLGRFAKSVVVCAVLIEPSLAQAQGLGQAGAEQSTAILDTAVLFAIGAREAEQAIRGSFGWPTFQEGFVEGVYFRFDPDGYARFSPSPRLDEDVFEVICPPASTACVAKKSILEVGLTAAGQVQILVNGITPIDTLFVSDRKSELPLPPSVLEPLASRLEALLSGGGELIVKREVETVQSVSLAGFSAVATFLRWVAQRQSPRVFPRGWPVPAQSQSQTTVGLTQPNQWVSPNAGPQAVNTTWRAQTGARNLAPAQNAQIGTAFQNGGLGQDFGGQNTGAVAPFNPNATLNAAPNSQVDQLQQQLLLLQNSLLQLQAGSPIPVNGNVYGRNSQSANLVDFGQSFAQQAQGRSLPDSPGDLGVGGVTVLATGQNGAGTAFDPFGQQAVRPGNLAQVSGADMSALVHRMNLIEQSFLDFRRDVSIQMNRMQTDIQVIGRQPPLPGFVGGNVQSNASVLSPNSSLAQFPSAAGSNNDTAASILSELEKSLLQRLDAQNQSVQSAPVSAEGGSSNVSVNRRVIEDILGELSAQSGTGGAPASQLEPVQPTARNGGENDFVTLSDYINQVLRTEGLQARDPGR